jgi:opacity protein-like surface antigen
VGASAEIGRYFDVTGENYLDAALRAEGRVQVAEGIVLFGGGDYLWEHEPRTSPDDARGTEPTEYRDASAFAGVSGRFTPFTFRAGVNYRLLDFDDVAAPGGATINNDDRDRRQLEVGSRVGYLFSANAQAFLQVVYDDRRYDSAVDDAGVTRDSQGVQVAVGLAGEIGDVKGEVLVGGLFYDYDDPAFGTVNTVDIGADVTWRPNARTKLTALVEREVAETTLTGAAAYVSTGAGARISHWVAPDLSTFGYAFVTQNDYQSVSRIDYITELGFGLRYFLTPHAFLGARYGFESRLSDVAAADYDSHVFMLSLGADLDPAWKGAPALASAEAGGFYVGAQAMDGALITALAGPRGGGGTLVADFGDFGNAGGVFAGYRAIVNDVVLGLEVEGDIGEMEWTHRGNRTFSASRKNSFGLSGTLGFLTLNDVQLYARAGIASTEFESTYRQGGNVTSLSERETGLRLGLGAEFPIGGGLSGRMEYTFTDYSDYSIGAPLGGGNDDRFANAEAVARLGVVYHFGAEPQSEPVSVDFSGFYGGLQVGHEILVTENVGPRPAAAAPAFTLDATRAGNGFTAGAFVGYGMTFGDIYLGAEVDSEFANTNWNIERDPTGRIYSIEKKASAGGSLRAGYVVNDAVLVYLRGGLVGTRYENEYAVGGAVVDESEVMMGTRFGGGIEFAASEDVRVRLDYTRSFYPDYAVTYPTGSDQFDPSESLFRIGVAVGF